MGAKQQLAPQWASLFRLGEDYNFYSQCQSFIQVFSYPGIGQRPQSGRKLQIPSSKETPSTKHQISGAAVGASVFGISLVLGA
jgi:hypothetical protein